MLKKFSRLLWIIYNVDHCPPALTECRQDSAFKMKIIMKDNRLFIMFTRFLWIIYNVDHWPHAQMPLPERVVKALRYNTFTNTEAQFLWSGWPNKKDALPFLKPWECIYVLKLRLWAYFWGIENNALIWLLQRVKGGMMFLQNRNAQNVLSTCFLLALGVLGVGMICSISKNLSLCCRKIKMMIKFHVVRVVDHVVPGAQDSG